MTVARWRDRLRAGLLGGAALLAFAFSCTAQAKGRDPLKIPGAQYEPVTWAAIDGWAEDDQDEAFQAFLQSCKAILSGTPSTPMGKGLYQVCQKARVANPHRPGEARAFFEQNFRPVRISPLGTPDGFVTGYYEPIVEGTRAQGDGYDHPLYRKPPGLTNGRMSVAAAATGKKKKKKRKLVAFYDRAAIDDGVLAGRNLEICWLRDPIDSFFIQIQGSVRVLMDDGKLMRLNYQAANGHPYYPIGKWLIEKGFIPKDEMSMDRIRQWMTQNPEGARGLMRKNKSYVFFRETNLSSNQEPVGAQGVSLTPGRSIAVDRKLHTYGTPFFISAYLPIQGLKPDTWFKRLMIAQDTGGAIVGPARADIYFGAGDEAESVAGRLRHNARFVMLLPKPGGPADTDEVPLPRPRPQILIAEESPDEPAQQTHDAKPDAGKPEPGRAEPQPAAKDKPARLATANPAQAVNTAEKKPDPKADKPAAKSARQTRSAKLSPSNTEPAKKEAAKAETAAGSRHKKKKASGKSASKNETKTASRTDSWESRVMPVIKLETPGKKSQAKKKK